MAGARGLALKRPSAIPGFGLALGFTLTYLSLIVLIPLAALFLKTTELTFQQFLAILTARRTLHALQISFGLSLFAAVVNVFFGLLVAWALVRYRFPGKRVADAIVDIPFALPTAVAGITFVILVCALIASLFDRQFAVLAERETLLLRESEEQFRKLYRETPLPLYSLAPDGKIEQASDAWLELIGYERAEAVGRELTDFMTEDSRARYEQTARPILRADGEAQAIQRVFDAVHAADPDPKLLSYQYLQMLPKLAQGSANKVFVIPSEFSQAVNGLGNMFSGGAGGAANGEQPSGAGDIEPSDKTHNS